MEGTRASASSGHARRRGFVTGYGGCWEGVFVLGVLVPGVKK